MGVLSQVRIDFDARGVKGLPKAEERSDEPLIARCEKARVAVESPSTRKKRIWPGSFP